MSKATALRIELVSAAEGTAFGEQDGRAGSSGVSDGPAADAGYRCHRAAIGALGMLARRLIANPQRFRTIGASEFDCHGILAFVEPD